MSDDTQEDGSITFAATFHAMPETEVFVNKGGGISIAQDDADGYQQIIVFPVQMAERIAAAIIAAAQASINAQAT